MTILGAALSAVTGTVLRPAHGAEVLLAIIIGSALIGLIAVILTFRREARLGEN
jgi:hypothetical protein